MRLGGPQSRSGRGGEEKNSQPPRESNPRTPIKKRSNRMLKNLGELGMDGKVILNLSYVGCEGVYCIGQG
jgi:hypothetical protein